jgi:hypothetical protein
VADEATPAPAWACRASRLFATPRSAGVLVFR